MPIAANIQPPQTNEYHEFYLPYIRLADRPDFLKEFEGQPAQLRQVMADLPPGEDSRLHEPYTWTLKQVVGHMIDCERVFSGRMHRIAVGDTTPIPGIDHGIYVSNLNYVDPSMEALMDEFEFLRRANVMFVKRLSSESLARMGTASNNPVSARANLYVLAGHFAYHLEIIKKRLGKKDD